MNVKKYHLEGSGLISNLHVIRFVLRAALGQGCAAERGRAREMSAIRGDKMSQTHLETLWYLWWKVTTRRAQSVRPIFNMIDKTPRDESSANLGKFSNVLAINSFNWPWELKICHMLRVAVFELRSQRTFQLISPMKALSRRRAREREKALQHLASQSLWYIDRWSLCPCKPVFLAAGELNV